MYQFISELWKNFITWLDRQHFIDAVEDDEDDLERMDDQDTTTQN